MKTISKDELKEIIERHGKWLRDENGGECADLSSADLRSANLRYANLSYANLSYADLSSADLRSADLSSADLSSANLSYANLRYADLRSADLRYADLRSADLSSAKLSYAVGGSGDRVQCLQLHPYKIIILDKKTVWGGCTKKTAKQWLKYTGKELSESDKKYLETVTKPFIRMVCGDAV
jgi:hypothetical protein